MAQRLRGLQRGAALLLHQAESAAGTSGLLPACASAESLLQRLQSEQHHQHSGSSWHNHGSVRHASWWSRIRGGAPSASTAGDVSTAPSQSDTGASPPPPAPDGAAFTSGAEIVPTGPPEYFPLSESDPTEAAGAVLQAFEALERASILGAKADAFFSASWCISGLQAAHDYLGTPWWISILIFNITLRTLTFPLTVMAQRGTAQMMEMNFHLLQAKKLQEAAMKATSHEEHIRLHNAFIEEYKAQTAKYGDPVKKAAVVPGVMLLNGAVFISVFTGISKLMAAKPPSLTHGGAAWFADLTVCDPYFGLPIMCTLVTLALAEYGLTMTGDSQPVPDQRQQMQRGLKNFMRVMALMFLPAGYYVAAGTALLWVSNSAFGVGQGMLLRNDKFRRQVGLPTMQALRDMNARVLAANAAATPPPPPAAAALFSAASASSSDSQPAAAAPLLFNKPRR